VWSYTSTSKFVFMAQCLIKQTEVFVVTKEIHENSVSVCNEAETQDLLSKDEMSIHQGPVLL